ncbi:hypothetical protein [Dyadobacter sp. 32]|uniref:hypothetical protein n=1 Tax=Dyadobacter sp. 32 TaxID=538966 RepID=UPI0011F093B2
MPLNWTVEQFNTWVDATFPDNQTRMISEADLRDAFKNTVLRSDERAASAEALALALNNSFIARSLSLSSVIYVDGTNGNDARTGTTDDNNAVTGRVKTLSRVAQLHSGKTYNLIINITGVLNVTSPVYLDCHSININILSGGVLRFKKYTTAGVGDGTYRLEAQSTCVNVYIYAGCTLEVEDHAGTAGVGDQFFYRNIQGAIAIVPRNNDLVYTGDMQSVNVRNSGTFIIGNNTIFCTVGRNGTNRYGSVRALYWRGFGASPTLGTNAVESDLIGDRTFLRSYHPISSTDAKVMEGETVVSPTNKKLWTKLGGTIRDAMGTTFA